MIKYLFLFLLCILASCSNYGQLTFVASLPRNLNENSGLAILDSTSVWFIEDGGNPDKIYQVDLEGNLLKEFEVKNAKNEDWEDLAADPDGNVYIGDLGNNQHNRQELLIYKIPDPRSEPGNKIEAKQIRFRYPAEKGGGSKGENRRHDAEALFYREGFLYIITKDRARPFTGEAFIYKVPAKEGTYEARPVGNFTPCRERGVCEITAADISPDGKRVVLLGYGTLWVFSDFNSDDFTSGKLTTINLGVTTQLESVGFLDEKTLLLSDEKLGATGRKLYKYTLE
jgi:hypothetical protein